MRAELENPRAITDLMAMLQPGAGNGQGRGAQSSSESFESVFRNTTSSQERTEVRQPNEARNDRSQPEQNAQRGELNRRGDSESLRPRNAERPDQTSQSNEAMQQQSSEAPSVDSASVTDSIAVCEEPDVNNGASEVMNRLAELLAMDLAAVEAVMNKLGFTPEDLADPINKTAFMKAAFGLESEVQLLNIPDVAQVHQKIAEVIEKHIAEMPTAKPLPVELVANTDTAIAHALSEAIAKAKVPQAVTVEGEHIAQETTETAAQIEVPRTDTGANLGQQSTKQEGQFMGTPQAASVEQPQLEMTQQADGTFVITETTSNQAAKVVAVSSRPAPAMVNQQDIVRQLAENMRFDFRGANVSEIKMTLRPESLGEVTMKIAAENGIVTASFVAENARVKEAIEANLNQLRQSLEEKGIEVSQLSVNVETSADERMKQFMAEQERYAERLKGITSGLEAEELAILEQQEQQEHLQRLDSTIEFKA